jgi:hypothetical protein
VERRFDMPAWTAFLSILFGFGFGTADMQHVLVRAFVANGRYVKTITARPTRVDMGKGEAHNIERVGFSTNVLCD